MIFATIDWLSISINVLLFVFVVVCLVMSLLILMQRPKQEGLGAAFGGGVTDQVFGARTTSVLQKGTIYLGSLFFIISLALALLKSQQNQTRSLVAEEVAAAVQKAESKVVTETPTEEEAPKTSLATELESTETTAQPVEVSEPAPVEAPAAAEQTAETAEEPVSEATEVPAAEAQPEKEQ